MQNLRDQIKEGLEETFGKKARVDQDTIRINVNSLCNATLFKLNRICVNSRVDMQTRRSGTGLVVIFKI